METGGWGRMRKCDDCGAMQKHFRDFFGLDGVCQKCGSERIVKVIARPRYTKTFWYGHVYDTPEIKSKGDI